MWQWMLDTSGRIIRSTLADALEPIAPAAEFAGAPACAWVVTREYSAMALRCACVAAALYMLLVHALPWHVPSLWPFSDGRKTNWHSAVLWQGPGAVLSGEQKQQQQRDGDVKDEHAARRQTSSRPAAATTTSEEGQEVEAEEWRFSSDSGRQDGVSLRAPSAPSRQQQQQQQQEQSPGVYPAGEQ